MTRYISDNLESIIMSFLSKRISLLYAIVDAFMWIIGTIIVQHCANIMVRCVIHRVYFLHMILYGSNSRAYKDMFN